MEARKNIDDKQIAMIVLEFKIKRLYHISIKFKTSNDYPSRMKLQ